MEKISTSDLIAALQQLTPEQRRAIAGVVSVETQQPGGGFKFSKVIDAVPDDDIETAIATCATTFGQVSQEAFESAFDKLLRVKFPTLANGCARNSEYRKKSLQHSVNVALTRLQLRKVNAPAVVDSVAIQKAIAKAESAAQNATLAALAAKASAESAKSDAGVTAASAVATSGHAETARGAADVAAKSAEAAAAPKPAK